MAAHIKWVTVIAAFVTSACKSPQSIDAVPASHNPTTAATPSAPAIGVVVALPDAGVDASESTLPAGAREQFTSGSTLSSTWVTELVLNYVWAENEEAAEDGFPTASNGSAIAGAIGPYESVRNKLDPAHFRDNWSAGYELHIDDRGRVTKLEAIAYDFGFPEKKAMETKLRALTFRPAMRATKPRALTCWLGVTLRPTFATKPP